MTPKRILMNCEFLSYYNASPYKRHIFLCLRCNIWRHMFGNMNSTLLHRFSFSPSVAMVFMHYFQRSILSCPWKSKSVSAKEDKGVDTVGNTRLILIADHAIDTHSRSRDWCTIMAKSSVPLSRGNAPFSNELKTMVHQCTRSIVIGSFLKGALPQIEITFQNFYLLAITE